MTAGGASCTTPCRMDVPMHTRKAVFSLYSGANEEVSIGHLTTRGAGARYEAEKSGEFTLKALATPLLITGIIALGVAESYQSDTVNSGQHSLRDETISWIVAAAGLVSGSLLYSLGELASHDAQEVKPEVSVELKKPQPVLPATPLPLDVLLPPPGPDDGNTKRLRLFPEMDSQGTIHFK